MTLIELQPYDFHFMALMISVFHGFLAAALIDLAVDNTKPLQFFAFLVTMIASVMGAPWFVPAAAYMSIPIVLSVAIYKWRTFDGAVSQ